MKHLALAAIAATMLLASGVAVAQSSVNVRGHFRADGTYVQPHNRTAPNSTRTDNWSSVPNVNPYTGKIGTVDPYRAPESTYRPYSAPAPRTLPNPYKPRRGF